MHGPASLSWLLVALCAATGAYCLLRMRSTDEGQRRAAGGEAVMGFGMAAMAVPAGVFTPPGWAWPVYLTVFGVAAVRSLWAVRGGGRDGSGVLSGLVGHHAHHLVGALAMVYMAAVMAATPSHVHAHGSSGVPLLTGVLLMYFAAYVLASGARLVPVGTTTGGDVSEGGRPGWGDRPELARACRLSMGIGMLAMLLSM
ncbi:DUF5134 domain-containing protein [Streptomyces acidiscabies]|uniref:DUF5134 domain-containing protein n=1 Tax=Streptomyces acidiscabies TaxID=42234 RepID=A0AAP6BJ96_9ACTN|nr:DUF5134 domain-containing protein [Streptomyces acidiscabies]MBZ3916970.1 DUF5134 domain-containing protein [Streptomyces acidiscabies]MDX2965497.1 DUF5134 domain-containing protein [Streptomyces acidiscabies]MDX3024278.1 DUF5134 domain-containing protein [Streptomyces acidiscabies]MDX3793085.1 DUF5134 domain-containing protein [Streptomyces acidiscabies]